MLSLQEKIDLVKNDMLARFPQCRHTVRILLWDDGTDLVECRHGSNDIIHSSIYYDNQLKYTAEEMRSDSIRIDGSGREYYVDYIPLPYDRKVRRKRKR